MAQRPICFALTLAVLAVTDSCATLANAGNEVLKVVPNPSTNNTAYYSGTNSCVVGIQVVETSGQADTVQMTYSCIDSSNNSYPCTPSSDYLSVSKTSPATDSVTISGTGSATALTFTAYAVGVNGGASYTYTLPFTGRGRPLAAALAPQPKLTPSLTFTPLQDYIVPVEVTLAQGSDTQVRMTYSATIPNGSSTTPVPCTPTVEIITIHDNQIAQPGTSPTATPTRHQVVIHGYGFASGTVITFTATAKTLDLTNNLTATSTAMTYTVSQRNAASAGTTPQYVTPPTTEPAIPTGLAVTSGPIVATNQYIAAVTFPVVAIEGLRICYHAAYGSSSGSAAPDPSEKLLPLRPETSEFTASIATNGVAAQNTQNVVIDCTDDINAAIAADSSATQGLPISFRIHGRGDHSGPFGKDLTVPATQIPIQ
jgi:hypothetical protein